MLPVGVVKPPFYAAETVLDTRAITVHIPFPLFFPRFSCALAQRDRAGFFLNERDERYYYSAAPPRIVCR